MSTATSAAVDYNAIDYSTVNQAVDFSQARRVVRVRLRLTTRGRRLLTGLAALPLVIAALAFALNGGMATASTEGSTTVVETVTVEAGQSLWQLAEQIAPTADPNEVIAEVLSFNNLSSSSLQQGQQLAIPTKYTAE